MMKNGLVYHHVKTGESSIRQGFINMMKNLIIILTTFSLLSCSTERLKESTYHALINKQCMDTHGYPDCDDAQPGYEEYEKQREEAIK